MEFSEEIAERGSVDVLEWWNSKKQIWADLSTVALASVTCPAHLDELDLQAFDSDKETVMVNFCRANWKHVSRHNFSVSDEMLRIKRETQEEDEEEEDEEMETSQSFSSDSEPERTGLTPEGPRMSTPIHSPSSSSSSLQLAPKHRRTGVISDSSDQTSTADAGAATSLAATASTTVAGSAAAATSATVVGGSARFDRLFREMRANVQADIAQRQAEGAGPSTASATAPATATTPPATTGLATASTASGPSTASATAPATATAPPATAGLSTASTASGPVISGPSTAATPGPSAAASGPVTRAKTKAATLPTTMLTVASAAVPVTAGLITVSPTTADLITVLPTTADTTTASPTTTSATVMADIAAAAVSGPSTAATAASAPTIAVPDSTTDRPTPYLRCVPLYQLVDLVDARLPTTGAASSLFTRTDRPEPELIDLTLEDITSPWESIESNKEEGELSDTD